MSGGRDFLSIAVKAAHSAADIILENLGGLSKDDVGMKQSSDFVTRVDRESEKIIVDTIRSAFPDHSILAEESHRDKASGGYRWIIDPLDGTTNYIHGYPMFSVSIALQHGGEVVLGVILDPLRQELFTAEKGCGARLNDTPLQVSSIKSIEKCLVTTGFPFRKKEMLDIYLKAFKRIFLRVSGMRRAGSAALDLAHLAAGRCDGFFELGLSPWDIAAGSIIIKEAGGMISDFGGGREYLGTGNVVAGNTAIYPVLLGEIREVFGGILDN